MQRNKSAIYWVYTLRSTIAFPIRCFVTSQIIVMPSNDECITLFSSCFTVLCSYIFGHSCKVNSINLAHSVHRPLLVEEYLRNTISSGSSYFTDPFILINIQFAHTRITNWPKFRMPNWEFCKSEMTRKGGLRDEYNDRNRTKYVKCKMGL